MGSRIIRGNLLVVPVENSLLYVSPLYLRAEQGQLPELKRVIASYGDRVVMQESLPEALSALFEGGHAPGVPGVGTEMPLERPATDRVREAIEHYNQAIEHLKTGDWAGFGSELDRLGGLLHDMARPPVGH